MGAEPLLVSKVLQNYSENNEVVSLQLTVGWGESAPTWFLLFLNASAWVEVLKVARGVGGPACYRWSEWRWGEVWAVGAICGECLGLRARWSLKSHGVRALVQPKANLKARLSIMNRVSGRGRGSSGWSCPRQVGTAWNEKQGQPDHAAGIVKVGWLALWIASAGRPRRMRVLGALINTHRLVNCSESTSQCLSRVWC